MKNNEKLLEGLQVLDFSSRLPGPLATHALTLLGARVIKIEDQSFPDSFDSHQADSNFNIWYKELNNKKEIKRFDFQNPNDQQAIKELIAQSDGAIIGLGQKIKKIIGLNEEALASFEKPFTAITIKASRDQNYYAHDLNIAAELGLLRFQVGKGKSSPPFIPALGIVFSQLLAQKFLAGYIKSLRSKQPVLLECYMREECADSLSFLTNSEQESLQLHNGAYPCYNIYELSDGNFVALAAVEERFWQSFTQTFDLDLSPEDRFNRSIEVFDKISSTFIKLDSSKFCAINKSLNICLSLIETN